MIFTSPNTGFSGQRLRRSQLWWFARIGPKMKIYQYWQIEGEKLVVGKEEIEVKCYGDSNIT